MNKKEKRGEKTNLYVERCVLDLTFAIVDVQASARRSLKAQSGQDAPWILPRIARRQSRFLRREHMTTSNVDWNMAQRCFDGCVFPSLGFDGRLGIPIIIDFTLSHARKHTLDSGRSLSQDRSDQNGRAEEELQIGAGEGWVVRELEPLEWNVNQPNITHLPR